MFFMAALLAQPGGRVNFRLLGAHVPPAWSSQGPPLPFPCPQGPEWAACAAGERAPAQAKMKGHWKPLVTPGRTSCLFFSLGSPWQQRDSCLVFQLCDLGRGTPGLPRGAGRPPATHTRSALLFLLSRLVPGTGVLHEQFPRLFNKLHSVGTRTSE